MRRGLLVLLLLLVLPSVARATGPQTFPYGGTGSGAPADATYVTQTPNATLTNEQALSALSTGLLLNTTGTGVLSSYAGSTCLAGAAPRGLDASGSVQNCTTFLTAEVDGSTTNELQNLFETISTPSGTSPVADSTTDTLTLAAGGIITITGNATTDTITISATEVDGSTTNELQSLFETIATSSGTSPVADSITDTLTINGTAPVIVTGNSTTDTITLSLADVTDCSANQFVTGSGANLALVCAQPSAANLSNGVIGSGAVVLQNSPTIVTPTISATGFGNAQHDHSGGTSGGTIAHSSTTGKGSDDHTQYALLAGRSGGQTLIGGTASGDDLTLQSTSNGTKGTIFLDDAVELWPNVPDIAASSATQNVLSFSADLDVSGVASSFRIIGLTPTVHVGQASSLFTTIGAVVTQGMTIAHDDATATSANLPFAQLFWAGHKILTTVAVGSPANFTLFDQTQITASGAITVPSGSGAFMSSRIVPTISAISGATFTYPEVTGIFFNPSLSTDNGASDGTAVTVTNMYGARFKDWTNSGGDGTESVGTYVAVDIEALSNSTTSIGLRNADITAYTPPSIVTVGAGFTLTATATTQKIDATTARTSSTTTAINDGVADGQDFYILNVDSTDAITIKTGANTDLSTSAGASGDCILNSGGVLHVMWSSDRSDWLGISCNSN